MYGGTLQWTEAGASLVDAAGALGLTSLLRQRLYGLALGYEDLNDHEDLRSDVLLTAVGAHVPADDLAGA